MIQLTTAPDREKLIKTAIAGVGEIATLPEVTVKIIEIVENPNSTARDLHDVIKNDPALSARILKVVNSAFYGLPGQIASVDRAIVLLGLSAVKNIAIATSMTRLFAGGTSIEGFTGVDLWKHAIAVGVASRLIIAAQNKPAQEEGFLAGLIHDLGLLVERQVYPKKIAEIVARHKAGEKRFYELEEEVIGADHQAFGEALAAKWRFPRGLCTTIGYHHKPMEVARANRDFVVLVHAADILACRARLGFHATAAGEEISEEVRDDLGLTAVQLDAIVELLPEKVVETESIFFGK